MFNLILDKRETKLIELLKRKICLKQLDCGDIVFVKEIKENILENDNVILIIERKTISDLVCSIKDGRHKEQKLRLMSNYSLDKIYYLIEGDILEYEIKHGFKNIKAIYGSMLNTLIRDNIKIIRTIDLKETVKVLETIYDKLEKQPELFFNNKNNNIEYSSIVKIKKKENNTPDVCFMSQLSQIQGVSNIIASNIIKKYQSFYDLCREYHLLLEKEDLKSCKELLKDIDIVSLKTGKSRKLGKVLSERIFQYLCYNKIENI